MDYNNVKLAKCGSMIAHKLKGIDYLVCLNRILTTGEYTDMNGTPVIVNDEVLIRLVENYNNRLEKEFKEFKELIQENIENIDAVLAQEKLNMTIDEFDGLPNQIDHDTSSVRATVGNLCGKMYLQKSKGKLAIFCNIKIKGANNVECVADNRWRNLSVQYNPKTYEWVEVSWVIYGADPDANKIMSTPFYKIKNNQNDTISNKDMFLLKCSDTIEQLERKIFVDTKLVRLCKLRKITKADSFFIKKELTNISDIRALSSIFNILNEQLSSKASEEFIAVPQDIMAQLHNTLKSGDKHDTYGI